MYVITDYSGSSKFWNRTHELTHLKSRLWDKLVPLSGEADTLHGEILRMACRLEYDIFNNGLCNDKREECEYLLKYQEKFASFLENQDSMALIQHLLKLMEDRQNFENDWNDSDDDDCEEDWDGGIDLTQERANKLDDVVAAVVRYVAQQEGN